MTISKEELKKIRTIEDALNYNNYGKSYRSLKPIEKAVFLRLEKSFGSQLKPSIIQKTVELMDIAIDSYHEDSPIRKERRKILDSFVDKVNGGNGENEKIYAAFELHREIGNYLYKAQTREIQKNEVDLVNKEQDLIYLNKEIASRTVSFNNQEKIIDELSLRNEVLEKEKKGAKKFIKRINSLVVLLKKEVILRKIVKFNQEICLKKLSDKVSQVEEFDFDDDSFLKKKLLDEHYFYNLVSCFRQVVQFIWYIDVEKLIKDIKEDDFFYYLDSETSIRGYKRDGKIEEKNWLEITIERIRNFQASSWFWRVGFSIDLTDIEKEIKEKGEENINWFRRLVPKTLTPIKFAEKKNRGKFLFCIESPFFVEFSLGASTIKKIFEEIPRFFMIASKSGGGEKANKFLEENFLWIEEENQKNKDSSSCSWKDKSFLASNEDFIKNPSELYSPKKPWMNVNNFKDVVGLVAALFPRKNPIFTGINSSAIRILGKSKFKSIFKEYFAENEVEKLFEKAEWGGLTAYSNPFFLAFSSQKNIVNDKDHEEKVLKILKKVRDESVETVKEIEEKVKKTKDLFRAVCKIDEEKKYEEEAWKKLNQVIDNFFQEIYVNDEKNREEISNFEEEIKNKDSFFQKVMSKNIDDILKEVEAITTEINFQKKIITIFDEDIEKTKDKIEILEKEIKSKLNEWKVSEEEIERNFFLFENSLGLDEQQLSFLNSPRKVSELNLPFFLKREKDYLSLAEKHKEIVEEKLNELENLLAKKHKEIVEESSLLENNNEKAKKKRTGENKSFYEDTLDEVIKDLTRKKKGIDFRTSDLEAKKARSFETLNNFKNQKDKDNNLAHFFSFFLIPFKARCGESLKEKKQDLDYKKRELKFLEKYFERLEKELKANTLSELLTENFLDKNPLLNENSERVLRNEKTNEIMSKSLFSFCKPVGKLNFERKLETEVVGLNFWGNWNKIENSEKISEKQFLKPSLNFSLGEPFFTNDNSNKGILNYFHSEFIRLNLATYNLHFFKPIIKKQDHMFGAFGAPPSLKKEEKSSEFSELYFKREIYEAGMNLVGSTFYEKASTFVRDYDLYSSFLLSSEFCKRFEEIISQVLKKDKENSEKQFLKRIFYDFLSEFKLPDEEKGKKMVVIIKENIKLDEDFVNGEELEIIKENIKRTEENKENIFKLFKRLKNFQKKPKWVYLKKFEPFLKTWKIIDDYENNLPPSLSPYFVELFIYLLKNELLKEQKAKIKEASREIETNSSRLFTLKRMNREEKEKINELAVKEKEMSVLWKEYIPKWGNERDTFNLLCEEHGEKKSKEEVEEETELFLTLFRFDTPGYRLFWGIISLGIVWAIFKILWKFEEFQEWLDEPIENEDWKE
jgi:hypothetical protein